MNSRQKFEVLCKYEKSSEIMVDYLVHPELDQKIRSRMDCQSEKELLDRLGCDFYYLPGRDISQNEGFMKYYKGDNFEISEKQRSCPLGIRWIRQAYDSKFWVDEAIRGPLENAETERDILNHSWPQASDFDFSSLADECQQYSDKVIIGGLWTGIMGDCYRMHGFQNFLTNIAVKPDLIRTLINRMTDMYLELNQSYFETLKGKIDIWFFGNDFGSQDGLLLNPEMWHEFFFKNIKVLTDLAHSYGLKVMMHSCGAISQIIPHLIEAGVDILDPIQVTAKGMQPEILSEKFGGKIIFHGGIDTQKILPFGSTQQVQQHCGAVIKGLNKKGGYIFAPSQTLSPDIPVDNVLAMYETVKEVV